MQVFCPYCKPEEEMTAISRRDGFPEFTCWTCGFQTIVPIHVQLSYCAGCDSSFVKLTEQPVDFLCIPCRANLT